jgi:hypothetical protein
LHLDHASPQNPQTSITVTETDMNQANPKADFIKGVLLVPGFHIAFSLIWIGIDYLILLLTSPFYKWSYNIFLLPLPIYVLGITQIAYLMPAHTYFIHKQRPEVGKGIIVGAIITGLVNGTCFAKMMGVEMIGGVLVALIGILLATVIGLLGRWFVKRRMR